MIRLLILFFLLSLLMRIWTQHVSSTVLPFWFLISGKPTAWLCNSLLIPGIKRKKLRDVLAAYLLCRCKQLSSLCYFVQYPCLKLKKYIGLYCIWQAIILIS